MYSSKKAEAVKTAPAGQGLLQESLQLLDDVGTHLVTGGLDAIDPLLLGHFRSLLMPAVMRSISSSVFICTICSL